MKITLRMMGGLGNQLFQICHGMKLSKETSRDLLIDTSWYDMQKVGKTKREFQLPYFSEFNELRILNRNARKYDVYVERLLRNTPQKIRKIIGFYFDQDTDEIQFSKRNNVFIQGYWISGTQSAIYFDRLTLKQEHRSSCLPEALSYIRESSTIALHLRLGDYLTFADKYAVVKNEYYFNSLEDMCRRIDKDRNQVRIIVFSDGNPESFVNKLRKLGYSVELFSEKYYISDVENFYVLSYARNLICANSTFSWWASRVNGFHEKNIIFPKRYMRGVSSESLNLLTD